MRSEFINNQNVIKTSEIHVLYTPIKASKNATYYNTKKMYILYM